MLADRRIDLQLKIVRDVGTYLLLEKQADVALRAAEAYRQFASDLGNSATHVKRLAELEHEGDEHTHRLQDDVAAHFITPLDKEDLRLLSQALDDITDAIEAVAARMEIYHITEARPDLLPLADLIVSGAESVAGAVGEMKTGFHTERVRKRLEA